MLLYFVKVRLGPAIFVEARKGDYPSIVMKV
jgi:hypothetical protein